MTKKKKKREKNKILYWLNEWTNSGSQFLAPGINPGWHKQKKNLLKGYKVVLRINIKTKIIQPHKWAATKESQAGGTMAEVVAQEYLLRTPLRHPCYQTPASAALPPLAVSCGPRGTPGTPPSLWVDLTDPMTWTCPFEVQIPDRNEHVVVWQSQRWLPERERVWIFVPRQQRGPCCHLFENFSLNKTVIWC